MVKILWAIILVMSLIELFLLYANWYKSRKEYRDRGERFPFFKNYIKLGLKTIIPALLAITGSMLFFL